MKNIERFVETGEGLIFERVLGRDEAAGHPFRGNQYVEGQSEGKPAAGGKFKFADIRPPSEDINEVAQSNFEFSKNVGPKMLPIDSVHNVLSAGDDPKRIENLTEKIKNGGYFSRPIVDDVGNVLEGQHRVEAAKRLGAENIPVYMIKDLSRDKPIAAMREAIKTIAKVHPDQIRQILQQTLEMIDDSGTPAKVREEYNLQETGFGKFFEAALSAMEQHLPTAKPEK